MTDGLSELERLRAKVAELEADLRGQEEVEKARQAEYHFRRAIESSMRAGVAVVDRDGRQSYVNRAFCEMVGWDEEELVGALPPFVYWPPEEIPQISAAFEATLRGDIPYGGFELCFQRRNGERFDTCVLLSPLRDTQAQETGWLASIYDITERKRTEQSLRESVLRHQKLEGNLILLLEASGALLREPRLDRVLPGILELSSRFIDADAYALWRIDPVVPEWRIVCAKGLSEAYQQQSAQGGLSAILSTPIVIPDVEMLPASLHSRKEGYQREGIRALLIMPLQLHDEYGGTLVFYYHKPHQPTPLEMQVATALANLASAALGTAELYDEQHDLRQRAEVAEQQQTFLAEASRILGSSLDYPTTLQSVANLSLPYFADWCGLFLLQDEGTLEQIVLAHADPRKASLVRELQEKYPFARDVLEAYFPILQTGASVVVPELEDESLRASARDETHLRLLRELGVRSYLLVPMLVRGKTIGVLGFGFEGAERRYRQEHLPLADKLAQRAALAVDNARLYEAAQKAIRLREQFLSIASHELKTPLTALLGYLELFRRYATRERALSEREQRTLAAIQEQGMRLDQLVNTLLDVSRIETGQLSIERRAVELARLVQEIVEELRPSLEQHSLLYQGADVAAVVEGDALRLHQLFQNLLGNAVKYSPQGGTITVSVKATESHMLVTVSDQGIGIPQAALPHLFERFFRAPNVDERYLSGMGIGLYVVREIAALHGGTIEVTSQEGRGSTFTVRLPLLSASPPMSKEFV